MSLPEILKSFEARRGATAGALHDAERQRGQSLPVDYKAMLLESDGLEGFISEDVYISLWSASDLARLNDGHAVSEFIPGVTLLGTDGGNTGYGFRNTSGQVEYVAVPLVGMDSSVVSVIGKSLVEVLQRLAR